MGISTIERTKLFRMVEGFKNFDRPFKPKITDCREIFRNINRNIFSSALPMPKFRLMETDEYWGMCEVNDEPYEECNDCTIYVNKNFLSKKLFVFTIAHEMVHQWEWITNKKMTHGPDFFQWRDDLKEFNIVLTRSYRIRHYRLDN